MTGFVIFLLSSPATLHTPSKGTVQRPLAVVMRVASYPHRANLSLGESSPPRQQSPFSSGLSKSRPARTRLNPTAAKTSHSLTPRRRHDVPPYCVVSVCSVARGNNIIKSAYRNGNIAEKWQGPWGGSQQCFYLWPCSRQPPWQ